MGPLIPPPPPPSPPHSSQPHPPPIPLGSRLNPISVPDSTLSLAGLLNVLDGVEEQKGILYILTSSKSLFQPFELRFRLMMLLLNR